MSLEYDGHLTAAGEAKTLFDNSVKIFEEADADGDGQLDKDELRQLMERKMARPLSKAELDAAMAAMDSDGSGKVDVAELHRWLSHNPNPSSPSPTPVPAPVASGPKLPLAFGDMSMSPPHEHTKQTGLLAAAADTGGVASAEQLVRISLSTGKELQASFAYIGCGAKALPMRGAELISAQPKLAECDLTNASEVKGKLLLIHRGEVSFPNAFQ